MYRTSCRRVCITHCFLRKKAALYIRRYMYRRSFYQSFVMISSNVVWVFSMFPFLRIR